MPFLVLRLELCKLSHPVIQLLLKPTFRYSISIVLSFSKDAIIEAIKIFVLSINRGK